MNFSTRLHELRQEKNLTQKELAAYVGLSANSICEWEKGRCQPGIEQLIALSSLFECSIDYLVGTADDFGVINFTKEPAELTPDGKELIEIFNALEKEYRAQILEYARYFAQRRGIKTKNV